MTQSNQLEQCLYFEDCPIKNFKPKQYECDGLGKIRHILNLDNKEIFVNCDNYKPREITPPIIEFLKN